MQQLSSLNKNDEIDFVELISVLWKNKISILLSAFVFTVIAAVYAFTAKEQWTSRAVVIVPKVASMKDYLSLRNEYANILNVKDFTSQQAVDNLFNNFKIALLSDDVKREFFARSKWFEQFSQKASSEDEKQKLLSTLISKNLIVTFPDLKKNPNQLGVNISFSTETPKDAQEVLKEYINFVNKSVLTEDKIDFLSSVQLSIDNLSLQKDKIQYDEEYIRQVQLENLNNALGIAKSAGIKEYTKTIDNINIPQIALGDGQIPFTNSKLSDGSYLFMLGEKYLQAQVDTLSNNKIIFPVSFYTVEKQISLLKALQEKLKNDTDANAYYYLMSPDYPVQRDWPKRLIILIIGATLGGIIGCVIVIIRNLLMPRH